MALTALLCVVACLAAALKFFWDRRRLYYHSWNLPGPFNLPFVGAAYRVIGDAPAIAKTLNDIYAEYPDLAKVWFGGDLFYMVTKPEHLEVALNASGCYSKSVFYEHIKSIVGDGLISAPVATWKRHRKIIAPTLNQKILNGYHETISAHCQTLLAILENKCRENPKLDIYRHVTNCALDIICDTIMGVRIDAQKNNANYSHLFDRLFEILFLKMLRFWYHFDFIYKRTKDYRDECDVIMKLKNLTNQIIEKKTQIRLTERSNEEAAIEEETQQSFLAVLIDHALNNEITRAELEDELTTFLLAGTDTNATSSCFILTLLALHPVIQEKLYEEVLEVIGPDREILLEDLPNLKYTECVIKESLRVFPGAPFLARQVDEDVVLENGKLIMPKGSHFAAGILALHRRDKYWPDPLKFDPDRFLPKNSTNRHAYTWLPFSKGPRNCVGWKYGMLVMKTMIPNIVRKFRIVTSYKSIQEIELTSNIVLKPKNGFDISLERR